MNKTVLITGASRGIGSACAVLFGQKGFNVAVNCLHSVNSAEKTADKIVKSGGDADVFKADVSNYEQVEGMVKSINEKFGKVDVLINNAGIAQQKLFTDITEKEWSQMINVNLSGVFNCCHAVLPQMIKNHSGRIINISSMWGEVGGSCEVHYSAAKAGVIGLTKALAKEVAPSGITVNCISPGVILTDMMKDFDEETLNSLKEETPVNRLGSPADIAAAAFFLAGDEASFITGQVLGVNGGII